MPGRPLTLLGGGSELTKLVGQLVVPPQTCSVIGSIRALAEARIPAMVGVPIDGSGSASALPLGVRLAAGIVQAIERDPDVQRLIVALDETDEIGSAAFTVLSDTQLQASVYLDGIVATVDGVEMSTRLASGQPVATARGLDRLAMADRILVARGADLTPSALGAVAHVLRSLNQTGPIIAPAIAPCSLDNLLDLDAWSGSPSVGRRPDRASPFLGPDDPSTVVCRVAEPLDLQALDRWLDQVLAEHADRVLRLLGAVSVTTAERRTFLHGIGPFLRRSHGLDGHVDGKDNSGLVALVGRGLPADALQSSFSSCLP